MNNPIDKNATSEFAGTQSERDYIHRLNMDKMAMMYGFPITITIVLLLIFHPWWCIIPTIVGKLLTVIGISIFSANSLSGEISYKLFNAYKWIRVHILHHKDLKVAKDDLMQVGPFYKISTFWIYIAAAAILTYLMMGLVIN